MIIPFSLTHEEQAFIERSLDDVSRTFALTIPMLEAPLDSIVGIAYLLCRVADNIEDCEMPLSFKQARFEELVAALLAPHTHEELLSGWDGLHWEGLRETEEKLMGSTARRPLFALFGRMHAGYRDIIARWVSEMVRGMTRYQRGELAHIKRTTEGVRVLTSLQEFDRYCYYVAGTVGRMVTELHVLNYPLSEDSLHILNYHCEAFGRGLQKTNILKDFASDLRRGVSYLPYSWMALEGESPLRLQGASRAWKVGVVDHVRSELGRAVDYILALPYHVAHYRRFCITAVVLAYATLRQAADDLDRLFTDTHHVHISRNEVASALALVEVFACNNHHLLAYREQTHRALDMALGGAPPLGYSAPHVQPKEHFYAPSSLQT